jgi:pimeloyl-ACP methyl ester carboxylesterase
MTVFDEWRSGGTEFHWQSTTAANSGADVTVFSRRCGTPGAPALVCVHGFPTASIDFHALTRELDADFDIYLLDFPGYGLSDKPSAPYVYSLYDDARLLVHAITHLWQLTDYTMLTHDRGTSVGMIALSMFAAVADASPPSEVIFTNANIYLPLANLTGFQKALLDPTVARSTARATTPEMLAAGMGATTFMPRRGLADPEIAAVAQCFAHNDQMAVLPTRFNTSTSALLTKPTGSKLFSPATSTPLWCGACTTMSPQSGSPTTCGRSSSGASLA